MIACKNITGTPNLVAHTSMGPLAVFGHQKDLGNTLERTPLSWFAQEMNVRQRQLPRRPRRPGSVRLRADAIEEDSMFASQVGSQW